MRSGRGTGYKVGERHHRSKLTADDVRLMRSLHDEGLGYQTIGYKFDIPWPTVRDVITYRTWKHV